MAKWRLNGPRLTYDRLPNVGDSTDIETDFWFGTWTNDVIRQTKYDNKSRGLSSG